MSFMKVDDVQAEYWAGLVTRKELQPTLDQIGGVVRELVTTVHGTEEQEGLLTLMVKMDMMLAFIFERLNVSPEEFNSYMETKTKEFVAAQESARTTAEAPAPMVTLD